MLRLGKTDLGNIIIINVIKDEGKVLGYTIKAKCPGRDQLKLWRFKRGNEGFLLLKNNEEVVVSQGELIDFLLLSGTDNIIDLYGRLINVYCSEDDDPRLSLWSLNESYREVTDLPEVSISSIKDKTIVALLERGTRDE